MLTIDAWIIRWVFQPIVDALANQYTHFRLAKLAMYAACLCMVVTSILLLFTTFWWSSVLHAMGAWMWLMNAGQFDELEQLEQRGHIMPPILWLAYLRLAHIITLILLMITAGLVITVFIVTAIPLANILWMVITTIGWGFAGSAHYFAACHPGTPHRRTVFRWQPA